MARLILNILLAVAGAVLVILGIFADGSSFRGVNQPILIGAVFLVIGGFLVWTKYQHPVSQSVDRPIRILGVVVGLALAGFAIAVPMTAEPLDVLTTAVWAGFLIAYSLCAIVGLVIE